MNHVFVTLVIFYCYMINVETVKFEVLLENLTNCDRPQPPYSLKKTVVFDLKVIKSKGKYVVGGRSTVLAEVPFRNFSLSGYAMYEDGKKERWWYMEKITCRNFFGRIILAFGMFQYNKANCVLQRGSTEYKDMDLNRLSHKLPQQQHDGRNLYRAQLVADGGTVFCLDTRVFNKAVK